MADDLELQVIPAEGLAALGSALEAYQRVSRKTGIAVLKQKAAQLVYGNTNPKFGATFPGLIQLFLMEKPRDGQITAEAEARGFRLGRKEFGGGLSPTAEARARQRMGGFKSILATVTKADGRIRLRGVRAGKRGQRIIGGRRGTGGRAVAGDSDLRREGDTRLNFPAVAAIEEINLREAGRRFLGVAWLFKQWRRLAASDPRRQDGTAFRVLEVKNPRARIELLGRMAVEGDDNAAGLGDVAVRLSSFVPGTNKIGSERGLFLRAIEGVVADINTYLGRKLNDELVDLFKQSNRGVNRALRSA